VPYKFCIKKGESLGEPCYNPMHIGQQLKYNSHQREHPRPTNDTNALSTPETDERGLHEALPDHDQMHTGEDTWTAPPPSTPATRTPLTHFKNLHNHSVDDDDNHNHRETSCKMRKPARVAPASTAMPDLLLHRPTTPPTPSMTYKLRIWCQSIAKR
jgi:hypothetical protein